MKTQEDMAMIAWKSIYVTVKLINERTLKGTLVIPRDSRLSDVLNNPKKQFLVLSDDDVDQSYMLNKQHIVQVTETKSHLMGD